MHLYMIYICSKERERKGRGKKWKGREEEGRGEKRRKGEERRRGKGEKEKKKRRKKEKGEKEKKKEEKKEKKGRERKEKGREERKKEEKKKKGRERKKKEERIKPSPPRGGRALRRSSLQRGAEVRQAKRTYGLGTYAPRAAAPAGQLGRARAPQKHVFSIFCFFRLGLASPSRQRYG